MTTNHHFSFNKHQTSFGEKLFPLVENKLHNDEKIIRVFEKLYVDDINFSRNDQIYLQTGKIVGMILSAHENTELSKLISDSNALRNKILEALEILIDTFKQGRIPKY